MASGLCTAVVIIFLSFISMFTEGDKGEWLSLVCPLAWSRGCEVQEVVVVAVTL